MEQPVYDILDELCAEALEVSVETYCDKIEKLTEVRQEVVIGALLSGEDKYILKARRVFNLIN